jgi:sugar/nucleoside kinase (ribokinase family)
MYKISGEGMKEVLIVGSIGLDNLKTPHGEKHQILGGSISYSSVAARLFTPVNIVGVVGEDFPQQYIELFQSKNINLEGLEIRQGKTFRWHGEYNRDMSEATTIDTQLGSFADFNPVLNENQKNADFVFLANIQPDLQLNVLSQMDSPRFVMCDTMNLWIKTMPEKLKEVIGRLNLLLVNDKEAKMLTGEENLVLAAQKILEMGPEYVIIKKGEHGSMLFSQDGEIFILPAFPLSVVKDPTGAGDTFAGGLLGYLSQESKINFQTIKRSMISGTILASFTAQEFGIDRLKMITNEQFSQRCNEFKDILAMPSIEFAAV